MINCNIAKNHAPLMLAHERGEATTFCKTIACQNLHYLLCFHGLHQLDHWWQIWLCMSTQCQIKTFPTDQLHHQHHALVALTSAHTAFCSFILFCCYVTTSLVSKRDKQRVISCSLMDSSFTAFSQLLQQNFRIPNEIIFLRSWLSEYCEQNNSDNNRKKLKNMKQEP